MQLEKVRYTAKARAADGSGLLSPSLVVLCAATTALTPSSAAPAQQPAQAAGRNQGNAG